MSFWQRALAHPIGRIAVGLLGAVILYLTYLLTGELREEFLAADITSVDAIRDWVDEAGTWAAVLFVFMVTFRGWFLLPSFVILPAGGLLFGFGMGTALGCIGIWISGSIRFAATRIFVRGPLKDQIPQKVRAFEDQIERAGPWLVAAATAHPIGPLAPVHWGSGLTSMSIAAFALSQIPSAAIRAGASSLLGARLADWGLRSPEFWALTLGFVLVFGAPLLHPGVRNWLFGADPRAAVESNT